MPLVARNRQRSLSNLILRWPTARSKGWTSEFLESAQDDPNVVVVVAIGSAVRPNVRSTDLDLMIICKNKKIFSVDRPIEIDIRLYSRSVVDRLLAEGHDVLAWAVKYGHILFQRGGYWDQVLARWKAGLPLPSPAISRQRAADSLGRLFKVYRIGDLDAVHEQALSCVTHLAWAELLERGVLPASRPELPVQLRTARLHQTAACLEALLNEDSVDVVRIGRLLEPETVKATMESIDRLEGSFRISP